jgi:molecular chaperone GrpE
MPHRTRAEERIDEIDISPTKLLADIDQLRTELQATTARAGEDLIRKVLAIADDFDLAIDNRPPDLAGSSWVEGVTAIDRKLRALLDSEGVRPVEAEPGKPFDPREHEAIVNVPGTGRAEGEIVDVIRRGYKLRDRVLRPALVAVAAAPDPDPDPAARPN